MTSTRPSSVAKRYGFETEEIASIQVENETWGRLKVTFPD
jgi:hypothetical protein